MESVYEPERYHSSERFNTKEYFEKFQQICPFNEFTFGDISGDKTADIIFNMGVSEGEYDFYTVEKSCRYVFFKIDN